MSDLIKAIAQEVRIQQQRLSMYEPSAEPLELNIRNMNEKMVALVDHINELKGLVSDLECDVHFWKKRVAEKPAYHCPKCGDWFSEDELKFKGEKL